MTNKDRIAKLKVFKYTPGGIVMPFFILAFAGMGTYLVTQSRAGTVSYSSFYNSNNAISSMNVTQSTDSVVSTGGQSVSQVAPSGQLTYAGISKNNFKSICYYIRAVSKSDNASVAEVEFVAKGKSKTVQLPVADSYRSVCLNSGSGKSKAYSVYNKSGNNGPSVLVYQAITSN